MFRKIYPEGSAAAFSAINPYRAVMAFHYLVGDREADTCAVRFGGEKGIEDFRQVGLFNAFAGVTDGEFYQVVFLHNKPITHTQKNV